jgi:hypothetical protein
MRISSLNVGGCLPSIPRLDFLLVVKGQNINSAQLVVA